jgi:hypothetical protein
MMPSITSVREMNRRCGCRFCSQFVGFIVARARPTESARKGISFYGTLWHRERSSFMRSPERMPDRGRPPPRVSWRRLLNTDAPGLTLLALFCGTLLGLAGVMLLATYYA